MKKIVGIIAAAAILATSVFAADVSATAKVSSDLFKSVGQDQLKDDGVTVDTPEGATTVFGSLNNAQKADYATLFSLQVSTDNAGGGVKYWGDNAASKVTFGAFNVWFKPTDNIKLSFKENGGGLFGDKYHGYYANNVAGYDAGYGINFGLDALSIDVCFGENFVTKASKDADAVIGQIGAKVGYNADFGSIAVIFKATNQAADPAKNIEGGNFKVIEIGAGYQGSFDVVGVVFNAGAKITDGKADIGINPSAGGNIDAISWAIDVPVKIPNGGDAEVGLNAKAGYALDNVKFTLRFEDGNLLAKDFAATIGLAIEGNVGIASWKVDPNYNTGKKIFTVGFEAGVGF